jgi:hypothetical protein
MGGLIIMTSPKWAKHKYNSRVEKSGLGLIARLEFSSDKHKFRIIGAYIYSSRAGKTGKGTFTARLGTHLSAIKLKGSPHDYLYNTLGKWVTRGQSLGQLVIVGGDFNAIMDRLGKGT